MTHGTNDLEAIPLHCKWVLWYDNPRLAPADSEWKDNLKDCGTFEDTDNFWRIFNNIKPAPTLEHNSNYHVFRQGIQPMWEDPQNVEGGKFVLTIPKKDSKSGRCEEWWLYTVLAMVGETMDLHGDQVCGAVVSIRKSQDRIALWLKSSDPSICIPIGERWKKALEFNKTPLKFQSHKDGTNNYIQYFVVVMLQLYIASKVVPNAVRCDSCYLCVGVC
jgi:translation initiation factor 4E